MNQADVIWPRKMLLSWNFPALLSVTALFSWFAYKFVPIDLIQVWEHAPVLRIYWGLLAIPFFPIFFAAMTAGIVVRSLAPESEVVFRRTNKTVLATLAYMLVPSFILSPILTQLFQRYYLPEHGYTKCSLLKNNPSIYFSDWVKNPAWCVRGKDRDWVFEQAGYRQGAAASTDATVGK